MGRYRSPVEQRLDRYFTGALTGLTQRHRAHPHSPDPASPRMPGDVVDGHSRAGEQKTARAMPLVTSVAYLVPNIVGELPLVQQARLLPGQNITQRRRNRSPRVEVLIEQHLAPGEVAPAPRLAAPLRPLNDDGGHGRERLSDRPVADSRYVALGRERCSHIKSKQVSESFLILQFLKPTAYTFWTSQPTDSWTFSLQIPNPSRKPSASSWTNGPKRRDRRAPKT